MTTVHEPRPQVDRNSMVVHIDGACKINGQPNAQAAWGVYFGPRSKYNFNGSVQGSEPQTSDYAEISALGEALNAIRATCNSDFTLTTIKIATDSERLVNTMTQWIEGWIDNGGRNQQGKQMAHFARLKALHDQLNEMEYSDDGGIRCQFWYIPREANREANRLANEALEYQEADGLLKLGESSS